MRTPSTWHVVLSLASLPGLIVIANTIYLALKRHLELKGMPDIEKALEQMDQWPWPFAVLVIGLGPGLGEELWCRGFLGRGLVGRYGVVLGVLAVTASAAEWTGFRGAGGAGVSDEKGLPIKWSKTEGLRFKVALPGRGLSNPSAL